MKFSRLSTLFTAAVVATSVLTSTSKAHALKWNLNNVTFGASGTAGNATGSFDYDQPSNSYSSINIIYTGEPNSGPITFDQTSLQPSNASSLILFFLSNGNTVTNELKLNFSPSLTNVEGSSSFIVAGSRYTYEEINGDGQFRIVRSGSTVTAVPFNIPGGATIPAVGGLLAIGVMRKARKSMASNICVFEPISKTVS